MRYEKYVFFRNRDFPFFIDRYIIQRNEEIPAHTHEFYEFVFVLEGSAQHEMNGSVRTLKPGDLFMLEPGVYHGYTGSSDEETPVYNVMFLPELLREEFRALRSSTYFMEFSYLAPFLRNSPTHYPYLNLTGMLQSKVENDLARMHLEAQEQLPGYELMIKTDMIRMLIEIGRTRNSAEGEKGKKHQMHYVLSLLQEHFNRPLTMEQFSRLCHMSPSTLAYKLKSETGKTFVEYKRSLQMKHACLMLKHTQTAIADLAFESGFEDVSYFYRVFRSEMGCTPAEYRKRSSNEAPIRME
jgi:AraC-like DNA-binding protein/quercetin dioxygenase-like cupin family protein